MNKTLLLERANKLLKAYKNKEDQNAELISMIRELSSFVKTQLETDRTVLQLKKYNESTALSWQVDPKQDIFLHIARKAREIMGNKGLTVTSDLNDQTNEWHIQSVIGLPEIIKKVNSLIGKDIEDLHGPRTSKLLPETSEMNLVELGTDLHNLSHGVISAKLAKILLRILNINHIYTISFKKAEKQFGNLALISSDPISVQQKEIIEAFILQISNILRTKTTINALHESEQKYRLIFEKSSDPNVIMHNDVFIDANDQAVKMLGYQSKEDLIGVKPWDISPKYQPDGQLSKNKAYQMVKKAIDDGFIHFEWLHLDANGKEIWFDISLTKFTESGTNYIHVILHNISERKLANFELKRLNNILAETGRIAKVGGWEFDVETKIGKWSDEVMKIHEVENTIENKADYGFSFYTPDSRGKIKKAVELLISEGKPYDLELELITAKGNKKWVRTIGKPVYENNKVVKGIGSIQDITEKKQYELEITKYRDHLEDLVKERTNELELKNIELEEKNAELEHFNKLFVGREFRIKELKQKIQEIEKKTATQS